MKKAVTKKAWRMDNFQFVKKLMEDQGVIGQAFVLTAIERFADHVIQEADSVNWSKQFITKELWVSIAEYMKKTIKEREV
jgi:hypothetical protein